MGMLLGIDNAIRTADILAEAIAKKKQQQAQQKAASNPLDILNPFKNADPVSQRIFSTMGKIAIDPLGVGGYLVKNLTDPVGTAKRRASVLAQDSAFGGQISSGGGKGKATENDAITKYTNEINQTASGQAPKVSVADGQIKISATEDVMNSPYVSQLKEELLQLKGADLNNPEVSNILDQVNKEVEKNWQQAMRDYYLGWTAEEYKDYQHALDVIDTANPMKTSRLIKGTDKDGNIVAKTPAQWVTYYREVYNTEERNDALIKSAQSTKPYDRTMALVLMQGNDHPIYGFDQGERVGKFLKAAWEQIEKFPTGTFKLLFEDANSRILNSLNNNYYKLPINADTGFFIDGTNVGSQEDYDKIKEQIKGKSWDRLTDDQKAFVLMSYVGNVNLGGNNPVQSVKGSAKFMGTFVDNPLIDITEDMLKNKTAAERKAIRKVSRDTIAEILDNANYDNYKNVRNSVSTWSGYDWDTVGKDEEELAKASSWAGGEIAAGNVAGTIGRMAWEAAVARGVTGGVIPGNAGININNISDVVGGHIIGTLGKIGLNPTSPFGKFVLQFGANLIGTVPEDIIQISLDNVLTAHPEENKNLLDPQQMGENLAQNFVIMAVFNAGKAGLSAIQKAQLADQLRKQLEMNAEIDLGDGTTVNIGGNLPSTEAMMDADDVGRAISKGGKVEIDGDTVKVVDENGNEKVMDNLSKEQGEMMKKNAEGGDTPTTTTNGMNIDVPKIDAESVKMPDGTSVADDAAKAADNADVVDTTKVNGETPDGTATTLAVEDTPDGQVLARVKDYNFKNSGDVLKVNPQGTQASINLYLKKGKAAYMQDLGDFLNKFHDKFGDVTVNDFDWVRYNIEKGVPVEKIVGTTDPVGGHVIDQNRIDAMKWWRDQPIVKDLREASAAGIGGDVDGAPNRIGYLPHTDYDPTNVPLEDINTGRLWQKSTSASVLDENGNYKGYGGSFEDRFGTYVSNTLVDAKSKQIAAAKLVEEGMLDGQSYSPELVKSAEKAASVDKDIHVGIEKLPSTKKVTKYLSEVSVDSADDSPKDLKKIQDEMVKDGEKADLGKKYHDAYSGVYSRKNSGSVVKQTNKFQANLDTQGNNLKKIVIEAYDYDTKGKVKMDAYHWGAADMVYSDKNAYYIISRAQAGDGKLGDLITDFVMDHSHRSEKYARAVSDKAMARLAEVRAKNGGYLTKADALYELSHALYSEGFSRFKKFLVMANYDDFNSATKKTIDNFLFNQMQSRAVVNNHKVRKGVTQALNVVTSARYKALFYGNVKNAILQLSETTRPLTVFKLSDLGKMTKRLATDADFRAQVDLFYNSVAPVEEGLDITKKGLDQKTYDAYNNLAQNMEIGPDGVSLKESAKGLAKSVDDLALMPIDQAEAFKNRVFIAALTQEAETQGLKGNAALGHVREKFERVALANNEMGRIGLSSNPVTKTMAFLQNFQIRELGMYYYNLKAINKIPGLSTPKKVLDSFSYLTKVFGTKFANVLILSRIGYSPSQTLGLDPLGITNNYNDIPEEQRTWLDDQLTNGVLTPLVAGGMTSLLSDLYFMARRSYIDSLDSEDQWSGGVAWPDWGEVGTKAAKDFIPGSMAYNRLEQMNEMMDTGWALSSTGNKMYTAPDELSDIIMGYIFGRSATKNAQQYSSLPTNLDQAWNRGIVKPVQDLLGSFGIGNKYDSFDPIDTKNYSDWFDGSDNDLQQFNKGKWHFQNLITKTAEEALAEINSRYTSPEKKEELRRQLSRDMGEIFEQVSRFVKAYENKHGTISANMVNDLLRMFEYDLEGTIAPEDEYEASEKAAERYSALGLPAVGTYTGPTEKNPDKEVEYQGSPQFKSAMNEGFYDYADEAAQVLKDADYQLKDLRKELGNKLSDAWDRKDYDAVKSIQKQYLSAFDNVVSPIIASYGSGVLNKEVVVDQLKAMLSRGTSSQYLDFIPRDDWTLGSNGRYLATSKYGNVGVDEKKWLKERFRDDIYKHPTIRSYSSTEDDFKELKNLINQGRKGLAITKALQIKARANNRRRSITEEQLEWINKFLELNT